MKTKTINIIVIIFLTDSATYTICSSNNIKMYSTSGKRFIKSSSNVFNTPTIENPTIIIIKMYQKKPRPCYSL